MAASIGTRRPGTPMMWGFGPTPDGEVLLQQPFQPSFASISDDIPLLIGTTFNELQRARYNQKITFEEARKELLRTFGDETDAYISAFMEAYPLGTYERLPQDLLSIDWLFRPKTIITADAIGGKRKADTYVYMYTVKEGTAGVKGSAHGAELKYCFDVLHHYSNQLSTAEIAYNKPWADLMSSVWAHFAHTGNPNAPEIRNSTDFPGLRKSPAWEPYTKENGCLMEFGDPLIFIHNNHDRKLEEIINRHCFKQLDEFNKNKR
jgi:para-nitrobenzyl esterase